MKIPIVLTALIILSGCGGSGNEQASCSPQPRPLPYTTQNPSGYIGSWIKNANQIVPISDDPNWFDSGYTSTPKIVYDTVSRTYRTFYTGGVLIDRPGREMVGVAVSDTPDGARTKHLGSGDRGSLFGLGQSGRYDYDRQWGLGTILVEDGVWKMWTIGDSDGTESHVASVGYALSYDQGITWVKQYSSRPSGAVFEDTDGCTVGPRGVLAFSVIHEPDGYYAYYYTFASNTIRIAYSRDGVNDWVILGDANLPVTVTGLGNIMRDENVYYLTATRPDYKGVIVFTSSDRVNWVTHDALNVSSEYPWQSAWMAFPYLLRGEDCRWYLFYTAADKADDGLSGRIGVAILN